MLAADGRISGHDERKLYGGTCLMHELCSHAHISTQAITAVSLSEKNGHAPNPGSDSSRRALSDSITRPAEVPGTRSGMQQAEETFCTLLDAVAEYLQLREQLDQLLKAGHLKVAKARYAMGPGSVGQTHYSSSMQASVLVNVEPASDVTFQSARQGSQAQASSASSHQAGRPQTQEEADASLPSTAESSALDPADKSHSIEHNNVQESADTAQSAKKQATSQYSSNTISELAAKFDTAHVDSVSSRPASTAQSDPLKWFGFMVSPHLRQAQADFNQAAQMSIQLGSAYHKMSVCLDSLDQCKQVQHLQTEH